MGNSSRKRRELESYQRASAPVIQPQPAQPVPVAAPQYACPRPYFTPFNSYQSFNPAPLTPIGFPQIGFGAPIAPQICPLPRPAPFSFVQPNLPTFAPPMQLPVPQRPSFIAMPQLYNQYPLAPQYHSVAPAPRPFPQPLPACAPPAPPPLPAQQVQYNCNQIMQQQPLVLPPPPKGIRSSQCNGIIQAGPPPSLSLPEGFQLIGVQQLPSKIQTYQTENVQTCVQVDPCPRIREYHQLIPCNNAACMPRPPPCAPYPPTQYCSYRF